MAPITICCFIPCGDPISTPSMKSFYRSEFPHTAYKEQLLETGPHTHDSYCWVWLDLFRGSFLTKQKLDACLCDFRTHWLLRRASVHGCVVAAAISVWIHSAVLTDTSGTSCRPRCLSETRIFRTFHTLSRVPGEVEWARHPLLIVCNSPLIVSRTGGSRANAACYSSPVDSRPWKPAMLTTLLARAGNRDLDIFFPGSADCWNFCRNSSPAKLQTGSY